MLRVMTVNLLNGEADPGALVDLLDDLKPDVVGAQEYSASSARVLEDRYPHGVSQPRDDNDGNALVATQPITVDVLDLPYRPGLRGEVIIDGAPVDVLSVHLANPIDGWRGKLPERRRQVGALGPLLSTPGPRILMGDLNSTPTWPAYRRLRSHLDDPIADLATQEGRRPLPTWGYRPGWPAVLRIDHILTAGLRAESAWVRPVRGTDHRAVVADLELSGPVGNW